MNKNQKKNKGLIFLTVLLLFATVATTFMAAGFYMKWQDSLKSSSSKSKEDNKKETDRIRGKVSKLMSLPGDEAPVLATIDDVSKLKNQPFFKDAKNGDKLLMFPKMKKAVIYREKENRLINVGPIAITSQAKKDASNK